MRKRTRQRTQLSLEPVVVIGYVAALTTQALWSEAEAPVVAGSEAQMWGYLGRYHSKPITKNAKAVHGCPACLGLSSLQVF